MKKFVTLLLFLISFSAFSQILNPVKWEFGSEKISETEYKLIFVAKIDYHWALYSQFVEEGGPLPTVFSFT
ncbi:MAG: thiol:disulfide interchange protein, partial [Flavobacteriaceae bacterium]|nr:thiol:disulfide interchange protein [Flavobacteriaceae bacterium]